MMIPIDGASVHFIDSNTFIATSASGASVIFAYHQPVCVAMPDGAVYVRMKKATGDVGRRVDAQLAELAMMQRWNGAMSVTECSEKEFAEVERMLAEATPLPPAVMRMAEDASAQPIKG